MASETLRIGFIGCGFVTNDRHLPALRRAPGIEAVAVADLDATALERTSSRWGIAGRYPDPRQLLADPAVEAVAVCTPAADHVTLALAALDAGKHVFVEKPLALTLEEADRLIARAAESKCRLLIGFNLRSHRLAIRARELLRRGGIGRVRAVRSVFADPQLSRPGLPAWRRRRTEGGGSLFDKGVHHFDLWRFLLGEEIEVLSAATVSEHVDDEIALVTARSASGVLLTAFTSDATAVGNTMTIEGDTGTLALDLYRSDGFELRGPGELPGAPAARLRRAAASLGELGRHAAELRRGGVFDASYAEQWRHFARIVRDGEAPRCDLAAGRAALAIALAALARRPT